MKKKQTKIKVIKNIKKGFHKDLTKGAEPVLTALKEHDSRIPAAGSVITKKYKGAELQIKVLENGFEYKGQVFKSISALAVFIVGGPKVDMCFSNSIQNKNYIGWLCATLP